MILSRISRAIREQNWFAVALEFIIVIAGVVIGFQVNGLANERADRSRESMLLSQLALDLCADLEEIDVVLEHADWRMGAIEAIFDGTGIALRQELSFPGVSRAYRPVPEFPAEDADAIGMALIMGSTFDGARHTYDGLISTGEFGLITNAAVASDIQRYYAALDESRDFDANLGYRGQTALEARHVHGLSANPIVSLETLSELAMSDARVAAELATLYFYSEVQRNRTYRVQDQATNLVERLGGNCA